MPSPNERMARAEERLDNIDEKMIDVSADLKSIAEDVSAMREMLASYRGASSIIKYITHIATGIAGAAGAIFTIKH